jgi:hypothetical protein
MVEFLRIKREDKNRLQAAQTHFLKKGFKRFVEGVGDSSEPDYDKFR